MLNCGVTQGFSADEAKLDVDVQELLPWQGVRVNLTSTRALAEMGENVQGDGTGSN